MIKTVHSIMNQPKKVICSLGGGFSSTALMPRVLLQTTPKDMIEFVNCVLPNEHPDTWRLMDSMSEKLGIEITYVAYHPETKWQFVAKEDRGNKDKLHTPFDIFMQKGFIGSPRNDPCSSLLKRETIYQYIISKYTPLNCIIAVGIHADEFDRSVAIRENWQNKRFKTTFPIIDLPRTPEEDQSRLLQEWYGVSIDLYEKGFEHNNCAGACVKAGQSQWARLWYYYPDVYNEWERLEQEWNDTWSSIRGRRTILRITNAGKTRYISLKEFRQEVIEPAVCNGNGWLGELLSKLPGNPACMWCAAI